MNLAIKPLSEQTLEERKEYLDHMQARDLERLRSTSPQKVTQMLQIIAAMISCPIPEKEVLKKYIEMLSEYPLDLLELASERIIKTHKWNTFPKVAEFCEVIEPEHEARKRDLRETENARRLWLGTNQPKEKLITKESRKLSELITEMKKRA